jgi:hypothetical protein
MIPNYAFFLLIYSVFILAMSVIISIDRISDRFLSPIYVFAMLAALIGLQNLCDVLGPSFGNKRLFNIFAAGLCSVWLIYPATRIVDFTSARLLIGGGGFNTSKWRSSRLIEWLKAHPSRGRIYSNSPDGVYILAGSMARRLPAKKTDLEAFKRSLPPNEEILVIWFNGVRDSYLHGIKELQAILNMRELKSFADGKIYIAERKIQ